MKKIICLLIVGALFGHALQAQPPGQPNPQQRPTVKQRIDRLNDTLFKALHITLAQQKNIDEAFTLFFEQADKLMGNNPPPRPDAQDEKSKQLHEQVAELQKKRDDAVAKVLAPAAFKKYLNIEKSMRPGRPDEDNMAHSAPPKRP